MNRILFFPLLIAFSMTINGQQSWTDPAYSVIDPSVQENER